MTHAPQSWCSRHLLFLFCPITSLLLAAEPLSLENCVPQMLWFSGGCRTPRICVYLVRNGILGAGRWPKPGKSASFLEIVYLFPEGGISFLWSSKWIIFFFLILVELFCLCNKQLPSFIFPFWLHGGTADWALRSSFAASDSIPSRPSHLPSQHHICLLAGGVSKQLRTDRKRIYTFFFFLELLDVKENATHIHLKKQQHTSLVNCGISLGT